jgi:hypothetical protein
MNNAGYNQYKKSKAPIFQRPYFIGLTWLASFGSLGLLYVSAKVLSADIAGFRSCSDNAEGLVVVSCGKQGLNFGDLLLFLLFVACVTLTMSLFTAAWRMSRRAR